MLTYLVKAISIQEAFLLLFKGINMTYVNATLSCNKCSEYLTNEEMLFCNNLCSTCYYYETQKSIYNYSLSDILKRDQEPLTGKR